MKLIFSKINFFISRNWKLSRCWFNSRQSSCNNCSTAPGSCCTPRGESLRAMLAIYIQTKFQSTRSLAWTKLGFSMFSHLSS